MTEAALTSLVAGRRREGGEIVPDVNPAAPHEHIATVSLADPTVVSEAVDAAAAAFGARDFFTQWKTVYLDAPPTR
jgi:acyl-CoA reductase-like NAD-dependent aldehyde dehydrogenase